MLTPDHSAAVQNALGQWTGPPLGTWQPPETHPPVALAGRYVRLEPLDVAAHTPLLNAAFAGATDDLWTYLSWGPLPDQTALQSVLEGMTSRPDWEPWTVFVDGTAVGFGTYLRIDPPNGVVEIGGLTFSDALQQTRASTELHSLLIANAFAHGYRRVEWKCDSLNAPSRRAALRLGFLEEGTFVKATHYKNRSRDTTWFAITDDRWPAVRDAFTAWLDPVNFDSDGRQLQRLEDVRSELAGGTGGG